MEKVGTVGGHGADIMVVRHLFLDSLLEVKLDGRGQVEVQTLGHPQPLHGVGRHRLPGDLRPATEVETELDALAGEGKTGAVSSPTQAVRILFGPGRGPGPSP